MPQPTAPLWSPTVIAMCVAGLAALLVGLWRARGELAAARGLEKILALWSVCLALPLAVFGATHLFDPQSLLLRVPSFMPWRPFWVLLVGCALVAAAASFAARIAVRWSALLFGIMMFAFVLMLHLPGAIRTGDRLLWTIVVRELSFGGGAWLIAASVEPGWPPRWRRVLLGVGRAFVTLALLVFGVLHFLHPAGLPGVPLRQETPAGVPGRLALGYATGVALLVAGVSALAGWRPSARVRARTVESAVGLWILLLVVALYGPLMVQALLVPGDGAQVGAIDFFADTMLFAGVVLALAKVSPGES